MLKLIVNITIGCALISCAGSVADKEVKPADRVMDAIDEVGEFANIPHPIE